MAFSCRLDPTQDTPLTALAAHRGVPKMRVVRQALTEFLELHADEVREAMGEGFDALRADEQIIEAVERALDWTEFMSEE